MQFHENFISYHNESRFTEDKDFESDYLDDTPQSDSDSLSSRYHIPTDSSINQFFLNSNTNFMEELPTHHYSNYNKDQPFVIVRNKPFDTEEIQVKLEHDDRLSTKTKRIQKREKAKQRAMVKQDSSNFFSQNYSKYIPEGFNDPDLDDKTKKKMIQMIRNRISAQNSRDRKKQYVNTLEYARQKLVEETHHAREQRDKAVEDYKKLKEAYNQLLSENAELRKHGFVCTNCGQDNSTDANSENTKSPIPEDYPVPSSPSYFPNSYSRFASYSLTFAAIISCILITHITNQSVPLVSTEIKPFRNLGSTNELVKTEDMDPCFVKMESDLNELESSVLKNIRPLKADFDQNHLALYKEQVEESFPMCHNADQPAVKIEEDERGVIDYKPSSLDFLQEKAGGKNLPVLDMRSNWARDGSTLYMHNGVRLVDEEEKRNVFDEEPSKGGLEKSEFLQLFVPKNSLKRFNLWDLKNRYQQVINNENGDDNSIVELWCKVFLVRELSSNF